ncbi:hypothetical protein [Marinobacter halophilus]|uniref:Lipoprotein n=1 Tax=Marinobacter halophilus TaxID=1323740 RepID=A0A2T1KD00_9GAMM|nr:hypothetical protein [Marinobacter halophilus]PSF08001.1 hypothetical protein C7H08_11435 [Marinobacter halophilus]GGC58898.1 hypothetical protein GCM10011362_04160 [Marinobacter halophilus]
MRAIATLLLLCGLTACQNLPDRQEGIADNVVFLKAHHCLEESVDDMNRIHFGPCLKVIDINGQPPQVRDDDFIELPIKQPLTVGTSCVYRHADGTPIPATMETTDFQVGPDTFTNGGQRWYLHAHKKARRVIGCEPTLSRSLNPTESTN